MHDSDISPEQPVVAAPVKRVATPPRAWQRMLSGRRLDLIDPSPLDIEIADIAHGLARVARWNGQTSGPHIYSVAQHCLLVDEISRASDPPLEARWRLAILLHDAPEYVIGDMISPFKAVVGGGYKAVEKRLLSAIHIRFGLPPETPRAVVLRLKTADAYAAFLEATTLAGFSRDEAERYFGKPGKFSTRYSAYLSPWTAGEAQARFLARFSALITEMDAAAT